MKKIISRFITNDSNSKYMIKAVAIELARGLYNKVRVNTKDNGFEVVFIDGYKLVQATDRKSFWHRLMYGNNDLVEVVGKNVFVPFGEHTTKSLVRLIDGNNSKEGIEK